MNLCREVIIWRGGGGGVCCASSVLVRATFICASRAQSDLPTVGALTVVFFLVGG